MLKSTGGLAAVARNNETLSNHGRFEILFFYNKTLCHVQFLDDVRHSFTLVENLETKHKDKRETRYFIIVIKTMLFV